MCVSGRSRVRGTSVGEWSVQCVCVFEPSVAECGLFYHASAALPPP